MNLDQQRSLVALLAKKLDQGDSPNPSPKKYQSLLPIAFRWNNLNPSLLNHLNDTMPMLTKFFFNFSSLTMHKKIVNASKTLNDEEKAAVFESMYDKVTELPESRSSSNLLSQQVFALIDFPASERRDQVIEQLMAGIDYSKIGVGGSIELLKYYVQLTNNQSKDERAQTLIKNVIEQY